ncbi:FAD-binding oxidoreductase [Kiritimatiellota bacterium B12222]|nr:FAD-binding oxidoreductase [Kiritimatiellota bacterium B12222]
MPRKVQIADAPPQLIAEVISNRCIGDEVYVIGLRCTQIQHWIPGDCIAVYKEDASGVSRPYSLSGDARTERLELWVRRFTAGVVSDELTRKRVGDTLKISPPFGWFRPAEPKESDQLYFATGTGISPFLAAIRSGMAAPRKIYWGLREPLVETDFPANVAIEYCLSRRGPAPRRVTDVLDQVEYHDETHIYACGLDQMIETVLGYFADKGIPAQRLHRECFFTAKVDA